MAELKQFLDWGAQGIALAILGVLFAYLKMQNALEQKRMELDERRILADQAVAANLSALAVEVRTHGD